MSGNRKNLTWPLSDILYQPVYPLLDMTSNLRHATPLDLYTLRQMTRKRLMQIWYRPAVHLNLKANLNLNAKRKRYARHSLLSPSHPPACLTKAPGSRRSAI